MNEAQMTQLKVLMTQVDTLLKTAKPNVVKSTEVTWMGSAGLVFPSSLDARKFLTQFSGKKTKVTIEVIE